MTRIFNQKKVDFPKTKQGLIDLLITTISSFETTYIVFCKELEAKGMLNNQGGKK